MGDYSGAYTVTDTKAVPDSASHKFLCDDRFMRQSTAAAAELFRDTDAQQSRFAGPPPRGAVNHSFPLPSFRLWRKILRHEASYLLLEDGSIFINPWRLRQLAILSGKKASGGRKGTAAGGGASSGARAPASRTNRMVHR
jgi:hypothetical protein